jgi:hypothetical protein
MIVYIQQQHTDIASNQSHQGQTKKLAVTMKTHAVARKRNEGRMQSCDHWNSVTSIFELLQFRSDILHMKYEKINDQ